MTKTVHHTAKARTPRMKTGPKIGAKDKTTEVSSVTREETKSWPKESEESEKEEGGTVASGGGGGGESNSSKGGMLTAGKVSDVELTRAAAEEERFGVKVVEELRA